MVSTTMIRAFCTEIRLNGEGRIAAEQASPRSDVNDIILAKVEGDELISFCSSYNEYTSILCVSDKSRYVTQLDKDKVLQQALNCGVSVTDFVTGVAIGELRKDLEAGFLGQMTSGLAQASGCGPLDMLVRGVPSLLKQAIGETRPTAFFECLKQAVLFYPGLMDEYRPHAGELAKWIFRGEKSQSLVSDVIHWRDGCNIEPTKMLLVEATVQKLNDGDIKFLKNWSSDGKSAYPGMSSFLEAVFKHPGASTIEAAELPHGLLASVNAMGVQLRVTPAFAPRVLADISQPVASYVLQGYDWRELMVLESFEGSPTQKLTAYLKGKLAWSLNLDSGSSAFWSAPSTMGDQNHISLFRAIATQDPQGFSQAFAGLEHKQQLACVACGYADKSWVDVDSLPQAGLVRVLESDLGL
jgi:hypothetical protein